MVQKILLQTTIPTTEDDWSVARFSRLHDLLSRAMDERGEPLYQVIARDRTAVGADEVLPTLEASDFDQVWLFAVDVGDGLTPQDCAGLTRFHQGGGGLMVTRDHMDLGSSVCNLGGVGAAHHFHTRNLSPDVTERAVDDPFTTSISWPNYHSGANGDFQMIEPAGPVHPVLVNPASPTGMIRHLPSHPHEGSVSAPEGSGSRVIAVGRSQATQRTFNIAVAFEATPERGAAIAQSTFHHFADYNWDPASGAPSFVTEPPGGALARAPEARADVERYVLNLAAWLGPGIPLRGR